MPFGVDFCMQMCTGYHSHCLLLYHLVLAVGHSTVRHRQLAVAGHPRVQHCAAAASLLCLALFACSLPDCTCCTPCPLGPPWTSWPPHDVSWLCCTPALAASGPSTVMLPAQSVATQGWSLPSCRSPSCQALWHTAGLGRMQAGKRGRAEPSPLLPAQHGADC